MLFYSHPIHLVLGLIIWSVWFVLIYVLLSVGCAAGGGGFSLIWINFFILCCTLAAVILLSYLAHTFWKKNKAANENSSLSQFIIWISLASYLVAIISVFSIGMMALFFPPCL